MNYLDQLTSDNLGPDYIPQLPPVPSVEVPSYTSPREQFSSVSGVDSDPWADLKAITQRPESETELGLTRFSGDISRFTSNKNYDVFGYDPSAGVTDVDGKLYDNNELKYQSVQTWGDVMKNAMGQFAGLTWNSFKEAAKSDGRFLNALFNPDSWESGQKFKEAIIGSPDELLARDKELKDIMNNYAIFTSPETDNSIFNKEMLGNMIGQLGFTVGTGAYILGETFLTAGIMDGVTAFNRGKDFARIGKILEGVGNTKEAAAIVENANRTRNTAQAISDLIKVGDIAKDRSIMNSIWEGMKNMVPGYEAVNDYRLAANAGATFKEAIGAGLPGLVKSYTMFNAARAEAGMEAAGTYGQLYMGLLDDYEKKNGTPATGEELQRIKDAAYGAATDNFIVNTGLLHAMNNLEFGALMSRFSSSKRLLREAADAASSAEGKAMYTVTGTAAQDLGEGLKAGQKGSKVYKSKSFGALRDFNTLRKDWGMGTALWQSAKTWGKGAGKFELTEGLQELLQETSNETFNNYYKDLYNANKDLDGNILMDITSADWSEGLATQLNMQGWKTFLMGATTGLFLSPISANIMYAREKGLASVNNEYAQARKKQQDLIDTNIQLLNQIYSNPSLAMREHIAANKTTLHGTKNMQQATAESSSYMFYNNQDDILTKGAAAAIKTGTLKPFLDTLRSLGDGRLSIEEFKQAMNIPESEQVSDPRTYINNIVDKIENYHNNYQNLMDKFSDLVIPEIYTDPEDRAAASVQKQALYDAVELLSTLTYHSTSALTRAASIKERTSTLPNIGNAATRALDVMGNPYVIREEIKLHKAKIDAVKEAGTEDSRQLIEQSQNVIDSLTSWMDNWDKFNSDASDEIKDKLLKDYKDFITAYNTMQNNNSPIQDIELQKAFDNLGDYIALNRDHGHYVEALNVLSNPKNFSVLHKKIVDGIVHGLVENKIAAEEEVINRAKATVPDEEPTTQEEEPTTTEPTTSISQDEIYKDIIDHFQIPSSDQDIHNDSLEYLKQHPDLNKTLRDKRKRIEETFKLTAAEKRNDLINQYNKEVADIVEKYKESQKTPEPVTPTPEEPKVYTKLPFYDIVDRTNLYLPNGIENTASTQDLGNLPVDREGFLSPDDVELRIYRNLYNIRPVEGGYELYQTVTGRGLGTYPQLEVAQQELEKKKSPYQFQDNPNIQTNREQYEIGVYTNGKLLGFITSPMKYTFTIDGKKTTNISTPDEMVQVYNIGAIPKEEAFAKWQAEYTKGLQLQQFLDKVMAGRDAAVITGTELGEGVSIYRKDKDYQFMNTPEQRINRPTLNDLVRAGSRVVAVVTSDGQVAIDNAVEGDTVPAIPDNIKSFHKALIEKGGKKYWLEMEAPIVKDQDLKETFSRFIAGLNEANSLPYGDDRRKEIVQQIRTSLDSFVTVPKGQIQYVNIRVKDFSDGVRLYLEVKFRDSKEIFTSNLTAIHNIDKGFLGSGKDALIDVINKTDDKLQKWAKDKGVNLNGEHLKVGPTNIREQISRNPGETDLMSMQVNVGTDIVNGYSVGYAMRSSSIPVSVIPETTTSAPEETTAVQGGKKVIEVTLPHQPAPVTLSTREINEQRIDELAGNTPDDPVAEREAIRRSRVNTSAKKVVRPTQPFTDNSVANIETFNDYVKTRFPEYITVEDLGTLTENLIGNNITVGQFIISLQNLQPIGGIIQTYKNAPYKYHEAFHAAFRLLLTQDRIDSLLEQANSEYPVTREKINTLRDSHPAYQTMDEQELAERVLEEYMADLFDKWITDRSTKVSTGIKGFFNRLLDWITNLFNKLTGRDIQSLFYEIDKGRLKNAHIQNNQFTDTGVQVTEPAMKVIQVGEHVIRDINDNLITIPKYLPQEKGEQLASTISALYHQMRQTENQMSKNQLLDKILDMYQDMLNPDRDTYLEYSRTITDKKERLRWWDKLEDMYQVFLQDSSRQSIKEAVDEHLQLMGYKQSLEEDIYAEEENNEGVRTTADFNKEADMFGGISSLSRLLREYIGSTTADYIDDFGNTHLVAPVKDDEGNIIEPGVKLVEALPAGYIYNGMMKVLSNSSDDNQLINRLLEAAGNTRNSSTAAFVQRVLAETGFDKDANGKWIVPKNHLLLQQVIKGFNEYSTNPLFLEYVPGGEVRGYNANRQDSAKVQFDQWAQANDRQYMSIYNSKRGKAQTIADGSKALVQLLNNIQATRADKKIADDVLENMSNDIAGDLKNQLGIFLHPDYIAFSIIASKNNTARSEKQRISYNANIDVYPISAEDITGIIDAMKKEDGNIFSSEGASTRLMKIAAANSQFDETVNSMTYRGADGEMRYSSQKPNYHMVRVHQLNDQAVIEELKDSVDHNNWLLNDNSDFRKMSDLRKFRTEKVDGIKVREDIEESDDVGYSSGTLEAAKGEGVAYKAMDEREFQASLLAMYAVQNNKVQYGSKNSEYFYAVPHLLTVIEAKSTGHLVRMPVVNAVTQGGKISAGTIDKLYQAVVQEFHRIKRVQKEIADGNNYIQGYNMGDNPRGLKLYNTKLWFSPEVRESIETGALDPEYVLPEKEIKGYLKDYFNERIDSYIQYLADMDMISVKDGVITNKLLPAYLFEGFRDSERNTRMNIVEGNFKHNIAQVYMNDLLNTTALRQLVYGNEAKAFKDNIDRIKRAAGGNAAGSSASFSYTAPELGIEHEFTTFHHVTFKDPKFRKMQEGAKPGDKADAQMYCTAKGYKYALFGFGKLTKVQANLLTKMEAGLPVTEEEFFGAGGLKEQGAFNSMKVVYFDNNNVYLKCSMVPLFKELTQQPGNEELDMLRRKLEEFEDNNSTVVYAGPETHSKGLKEYVAENISAISDVNYRPLESKWFRLQMENPSNKLTVTDPTQNKQQILSEQLGNIDVWYNGKKEKVSQVMKSYMDDVAQRVTNSYQNAVNQIFSLDEGLIELDKAIELNQVTPNLANFFKIMKETLMTTGADQQTLDFLEVQNGQPVYDLNFPSTLQKYTQIFFSYFSKTMAEKTPGVTLALMSDYGIKKIKKVLELDADGQPKRWKVVSTAEYDRNPDKYKNLKRYNNSQDRLFSGLKVGDYILDDLRHNYMKYDEQGNELGYFTEFLMPAHYREQMRGNVDALQYSFGVRIPSDDKHQYISLELVDTLPVAMGSTGIFPQELTEISGADFDIDKLFIQIADTYLKQVDSRYGEPIYGRVAYGTAETEQEQFDEYVTWQITNNRAVKNKVEELIDTTWSGFTSEILGADRQIILGALKELKMPSTVDEYIEQREKGNELNNGLLNNRILAAKIALLNNEHISGGGKDAIINQPTSTDPLTDLANELVEQDIIEPEEEVDINSLHGKGITYINNKEGQRNIGAAINAMLAFSIAEQLGLHTKTPFMYNGESYSSFSSALTADGKRKFAQISTIVNAMTDNAKERLAAKLGLNINAVGYVSTMIALGIPIKDAVLYMLQPSVREYFDILQNTKGVFKRDNRGPEKILEDLIKKYSKDAPDTEYSLTQQDLIDNITNGGSNPVYQLAALKDLKTIRSISDTLGTVARVMKLNQGMKVTWEDNDKLSEDIEKLFSADSPVDVTAAFSDEHPIFNTYIKVFNQVKELGKKVFIERTPLFQSMENMVMQNMKVSGGPEGSMWTKTLKNDLLSYLGIKAYINWLNKNGHGGTSYTLDNALVYDSLREQKGPDYKDITRIIQDIRERSDNYLVHKFLRYIQANDEGNKEVLNKVQSNTWAKLSEHQQRRLYDSFVDLYSNEDTQADAIALFNYLLVKDGGQFRKDSFIRYIPPFAFKDLSDRMKEVNNLLSSGQGTYTDIFGADREHLLNNFMESYGTHIGNYNNIRRVTAQYLLESNMEIPAEVDTKDGTKEKVDVEKVRMFLAQPIVEMGNTMTINIFKGIRKKLNVSENEYGIVVEATKGGYTATENQMMEKNKMAIKMSGYSISGNEVQFPYTIQQVIENEETGKSYVQLWKLKSVTKGQGKGDSTSLITTGELIPTGIGAVYEKAQYTGSRGQWKGAGVFGQLPVTPRRTTGKVDVDKAQVSPSIEPTTEQKQDVQQTVPQPITGGVLNILAEKYGIIAMATNRERWFEKDGQRYPVAPGTTPKMLLEQLESGQPVVSSQPMSGTEWKQQLADIYHSQERTVDERTWTIQQLAFRDQSRAIGATDEQILNTIKCL